MINANHSFIHRIYIDLDKPISVFRVVIDCVAFAAIDVIVVVVVVVVYLPRR